MQEIDEELRLSVANTTALGKQQIVDYIWEWINGYWTPQDKTIPTGTSYLRLYDTVHTNPDKYVDLSLLLDSSENNTPLLAISTGVTVKKDLAAGGILSANQGTLALGSGLFEQIDPPRIWLTNSEVGALEHIEERNNQDGDPINPKDKQLFINLENRTDRIANHVYEWIVREPPLGSSWTDKGHRDNFNYTFDTLHLTRRDGHTRAHLDLGNLTAHGNLTVEGDTVMGNASFQNGCSVAPVNDNQGFVGNMAKMWSNVCTRNLQIGVVGNGYITMAIDGSGLVLGFDTSGTTGGIVPQYGTPNPTKTFALGSSTNRWHDIYGTNVSAYNLALNGSEAQINLNGNLGQAGQVLTSQGTGNTPTWSNVPWNGGTVTNPVAGPNFTVGGIGDNVDGAPWYGFGQLNDGSYIVQYAGFYGIRFKTAYGAVTLDTSANMALTGSLTISNAVMTYNTLATGGAGNLMITQPLLVNKAMPYIDLYYSGVCEWKIGQLASESPTLYFKPWGGTSTAMSLSTTGQLALANGCALSNDTSSTLRIASSYSSVTIGAQNAGYIHFISNGGLPFYFNQDIRVQGHFTLYRSGVGPVGNLTDWTSGGWQGDTPNNGIATNGDFYVNGNQVLAGGLQFSQGGTSAYLIWSNNYVLTVGANGGPFGYGTAHGYTGYFGAIDCGAVFTNYLNPISSSAISVGTEFEWAANASNNWDFIGGYKFRIANTQSGQVDRTFEVCCQTQNFGTGGQYPVLYMKYWANGSWVANTFRFDMNGDFHYLGTLRHDSFDTIDDIATLRGITTTRDGDKLYLDPSTLSFLHDDEGMFSMAKVQGWNISVQKKFLQMHDETARKIEALQQTIVDLQDQLSKVTGGVKSA
ncbi:MAG: hypothetical protein ACQCN6_11195 [Candidatus Bathyarchaeia archaeon]|jgi:hypothetical protein